MFKKRLCAFVIDIVLVFLIVSFIEIFIPNSENVTNLSDQMISINNSFFDGSIDIQTFVNQYSSVSYSLERELFLSTLISVVINVLYFIVYPLYNGGQSFGKKYMNIKIVSNDNEEVSSNQLVLRYLFMNGIGTTIISLCIVFLVKDLTYVYIETILSFLQFIVAISSIFMVLYRNDKRSLPDLIAGTKVIEVEK